MKRMNRYLIIGVIMLIFSVLFIRYALLHPNASFDISVEATWFLYFSYMLFMIVFLVIGIKKKKK